MTIIREIMNFYEDHPAVRLFAVVVHHSSMGLTGELVDDVFRTKSAAIERAQQLVKKLHWREYYVAIRPATKHEYGIACWFSEADGEEEFY